jgi:hypothetical protein
VADLHFDGNKFNIALVIFYVPSIAIDISSNWVVKHLHAGFYIPGMLIAWGIVSTCLGFTKSYTRLLVARFFLGLGGGGLLGAIII